MHSSNFDFWRLPPATVLLVLAAVFPSCDAHAIPQQTKTVPFHELDVQPWPLLPTPAPELALFARQLNTVCGYIGGDPDLPATCSAGSHCAAEADSGFIGCCPDEGACTQGVFTSCVDVNSDPQSEINPYVYTCTGSNVCYMNSFGGGYHQYGCGSASDIAATVVAAASGRSSLEIASVEVTWTATAVSLSEPTTIGTPTSSRDSTSTRDSTTDRTSTTESSSTTSTTSESTNSEASTTSTITDSSTTSEETETPSNESTTTSAEPSASGTEAPAASGGGGDDNGAIIGGTVGGLAGALIIVALVLFLWRRRGGNRRQGPGLNQGTEYIKSPIEGPRPNHAFTPIPSMQETRDYGDVITPLPQVSSTAYDPGRLRNELDDNPASTYYPPGQAYGYPVGAVTGGVSATSPRDDEIPLTASERELEEFSRGFNTGLQDIREDFPLPPSNAGRMSTFSPSRTGGRPLWQQNRQSRNPMWM